MAQQQIDIIVRVIDKATAGLKKVNFSLKNLSKTSKEVKGNLLGAGLSMLFTGMAIKKASEAALRSIMTTYKEAMGMNNSFVQSTNRLNAAWTFFKFQLMDALAGSELFQSFITGIITFIDWLSSAPPWVMKLIVVFLIFAAIVGSVMMVAGQAFLAFLGIIAIAGAPILGIIILIIIIIIGLVIALAAIWGSGMSKVEKILWTIVAVLIVIGLIALLFGGWMVALVALIIAAIVAAVALIIKYWDEIKTFFIKIGNVIKEWFSKVIQSLKEKWQSFKQTMIDIWQGIKDFVKEVIDAIFGWIGNLIDKLKSAWAWIKKVAGGKGKDKGSDSGNGYQHGGYVPTTGPALLHAGEFVLSRKMLERGIGGVNVGDINVSVLGETTDADRLAALVSEQIMNEFNRYAPGGGI
jgi:hypothetical protein|tara:strand:- start:343 stop:1569 length:1227 start_codon:yes stop_codon:yes gene_type:complete